jgi:large subunit ribosomal protein L28
VCLLEYCNRLLGSIGLLKRILTLYSTHLLLILVLYSLLFYSILQTRRSSGASSGLVMRARVCDLLGKTPNRQARVVTFSHKRVKKVQHVNLQWKRFFSEDLKRNVRLRVSTKGIKTINKMGSIDAAAKKFELNLKRF